MNLNQVTLPTIDVERSVEFYMQFTRCFLRRGSRSIIRRRINRGCGAKRIFEIRTGTSFASIMRVSTVAFRLGESKTNHPRKSETPRSTVNWHLVLTSKSNSSRLSRPALQIQLSAPAMISLAPLVAHSP